MPHIMTKVWQYVCIEHILHDNKTTTTTTKLWQIIRWKCAYCASHIGEMENGKYLIIKSIRLRATRIPRNILTRKCWKLCKIHKIEQCCVLCMSQFARFSLHLNCYNTYFHVIATDYSSHFNDFSCFTLNKKKQKLWK